MDREDIIKIWQSFTEGNDFMLNPDMKFTGMLADGVLENEKKSGLKLCPCRIGDSTKQRNLELLCPCNFKAQETWKEKGRCWCGLFMKREQ